MFFTTYIFLKTRVLYIDIYLPKFHVRLSDLHSFSGRGAAERVRQHMHPPGPHADVVGPRQPAQLRDEAGSFRESGEHSEQHDGARRAATDVDRDG